MRATSKIIKLTSEVLPTDKILPWHYKCSTELVNIRFSEHTTKWFKYHMGIGKDYAKMANIYMALYSNLGYPVVVEENWSRRFLTGERSEL